MLHSIKMKVKNRLKFEECKKCARMKMVVTGLQAHYLKNILKSRWSGTTKEITR